MTGHLRYLASISKGSDNNVLKSDSNRTTIIFQGSTEYFVGKEVLRILEMGLTCVYRCLRTPCMRRKTRINYNLLMAIIRLSISAVKLSIESNLNVVTPKTYLGIF